MTIIDSSRLKAALSISAGVMIATLPGSGAAVAQNTAAQPKTVYDIVIKGGRVIDPASGRDEARYAPTSSRHSGSAETRTR